MRWISGIAGALVVGLMLGCSDEGARRTPSNEDPNQTGPVDDLGAITSIRIQVGELTFDARVAGPEQGELVFLLHGFPETSYEWRDVMPVLGRAGYRVVAPDQRGYSPGARPQAIADYNIIYLVSDVLGMADALGAPRFHVAGHDWGAGVAWGLAAVAADRVLTVSPMSVPHPDAFASLLADPESEQYEASAYFETFSTPGFEDVMLVNDAAPFRSAFAGLDPTVPDEYLRVLGTKEAMRAALNWYRANVSTRQFATPPVGPIRVPTLYIWSDGDTFLLREGAELTEQYVTGPYTFEVIEGADHWLVDREPERVASLLVQHLGTHSPNTSAPRQ